MQIANFVCRSIDFTCILERKSYVSFTSPVLTHLIREQRNSSLEKLYYFLADLHSQINKSTNGHRTVEMSARQWSGLLGCSEEYVFQMQKSLEKTGYFHIKREKDEDNQNEKNIITPTVPDDVFEKLKKEPNRFEKGHLNFTENNPNGCKRSFLDESKMFIRINLQLVKILLVDKAITPLQKLLWLHFFCRSSSSYTNTTGEGSRNFITNYTELANLFNCKETTISTALNNLRDNGYVSKKQFFIKNKSKLGRRKKKSCWEICALFPKQQMQILLQQPDRQNIPPLNRDDERLYGIERKGNMVYPVVSCSVNSFVGSADPHKSLEFNNKYNILNINKNIDQAVEKTTKLPFVDSVSIEQKLTISPKEISLGLKVAEKFDNRAFDLAKNMSYENAIKQSDNELTNTEHWLVTKAAFTLQKQYANVANNGADIGEQFTDAEDRLIALWEDFSNVPLEAEQQEFLLRKSWFMKLLEAEEKLEPRAFVDLRPTEKTLTMLLSNDLPELPGDKKDKAIKFAKAIRERGLAKGYAVEISITDLAREFIHHAATWVPKRLNCKTREEQIDAALSFAWKAAEQGKWRCPYAWMNKQIQQREQEAAQWKNW